LSESIAKTKISVEKLAPLADFLAKLDNEEVVPTLDVFEDRSHSFSVIQEKFHEKIAKIDFPNALRNLSLALDVIGGGVLLLDDTCRDAIKYGNVASDGKKHLIKVSLDTCLSDVPSAKKIKMVLADCNIRGITLHQLVFSPSAPVNLDLHSREVFGIPLKARYFSTCHGAALKDGRIIDAEMVKDLCERLSKEVPTTVILCTSLMQSVANFYVLCLQSLEEIHVFECLTAGGFAYFDEAGSLLSINVFSTHTVSKAGQSQYMTHFGHPEYVSKPFKRALTTSGRWAPTTLPWVVAGGARSYAWVLPEEVSSAPFGGFIYRMGPGFDNILFPIVSSF